MYLYSKKLTALQLHSFLASQENVPGDKAFVLLERDDNRVDWADLERNKSPDNASVDVGQLWDFRRAIPDGSALHVHVFARHVTVHLDVYDPAQRPLAHLFGETNVVRGARLAVAQLSLSVSQRGLALCSRQSPLSSAETLG